MEFSKIIYILTLLVYLCHFYFGIPKEIKFDSLPSDMSVMDTLIKEYNDVNNLHHVDAYFNDSLIQQKIYKGHELVYISPINKSDFPKSNLKLKSKRNFVQSNSADTIEINAEIPVMNRSVAAKGGFVSRLSNNTYLIKSNRAVFQSDSIKVYLSVGCSLTDNSQNNPVWDSLVLPIK